MVEREKSALTSPDETLHIAGLVLLVVAAVLAAVEAIQQFGVDRFVVDATAVLVLALVALAAGILAWKGPIDTAGILGLVAGIGFLLIFPETAGVLALLGAVLILISTRLTQPTQEGRTTQGPTRGEPETPRRSSHGGQD